MPLFLVKGQWITNKFICMPVRFLLPISFVHSQCQFFSVYIFYPSFKDFHESVEPVALVHQRGFVLSLGSISSWAKVEECQQCNQGVPQCFPLSLSRREKVCMKAPFHQVITELMEELLCWTWKSSFNCYFVICFSLWIIFNSNTLGFLSTQISEFGLHQ